MRELTSGNALVEAATFLAILFGLIAGGLVSRLTPAPEIIILQLMVIAGACAGNEPVHCRGPSACHRPPGERQCLWLDSRAFARVEARQDAVGWRTRGLLLLDDRRRRFVARPCGGA